MPSDNLIFVGIGLGVFASMTGTIGKQLFRFSELQKNLGFAYSSKVSLTIGLLLNTAVGPIVDMLSYMFAPQSLIAPLGGLDVVWNTLLAPCTLGEKLTPMIVFGVALIAGGATCTSIFGNHDDKELNLAMVEDILLRKTVAFYLGALIVWILFNVLVLQPRSSAPKGEPWQTGDPIRGLSLGLTAGSIAGNMFCVKAFIELLQSSVRDDDPDVWKHWLPYVMLVGAVFFALSNLFFLTKAMREYAAVFMGAVFEGSLIVCAAVSGIVVFSELDGLEWYQVVIYFSALACIVLGILLVALACNRNDDAKEMDEEEAQAEMDEKAEVDVEVPELDMTDGPSASPTAAQKSEGAVSAVSSKGSEPARSSGRQRAASDMSRGSWKSTASGKITSAIERRPRSATIESTPFGGTIVVALERMVSSQPLQAQAVVDPGKARTPEPEAPDKTKESSEGEI